MIVPSIPDEQLPLQELPRLVLTSPILNAVHTLQDLRNTVRSCSPSSDSVHALTHALNLVTRAMLEASVDTEWVTVRSLADAWGVPPDTAQKWAVRGLIKAEKQGRVWYAPLGTKPPAMTDSRGAQ